MRKSALLTSSLTITRLHSLRREWMLPTGIMSIAILGFAFAVIVGVKFLLKPSVSTIGAMKPLVTVWLGSQALADILLTGK